MNNTSTRFTSLDFSPSEGSVADPERLNKLFADDPKSAKELDFTFNPSNEQTVPRPQPRRTGTQQSIQLSSRETEFLPEPAIVPLGESFEIEFTEFGTQRCFISVVNGEVLKFDVFDGSLLTSVPISLTTLDNSEDILILYVDGSVFCKFIGHSEFYSKLMAVFSAKKNTKVLVFSEGDGDGFVLEGLKILFKKVSFEFSNNEFYSKDEIPENDKSSISLYMTPENLQDPFLKHFLGKRKGAKFVIGINGIGTFLELRRIRSRKKIENNISSLEPAVVNESSNNSSTSDIRQRMEKVGAVRLPIMNELKKEFPAEIQYENLPNPEELQELGNSGFQEDHSPSPEIVQKPKPAFRNPSNSSVTSPIVNSGPSLEKRVEALEKQLAEVLNQNPPNQNSKFEKEDFVMDVWAKIVASEKIPDSIKPEIKKLLRSAARES
ncbi:hypothetical protein FO519_003659 [Halicephalobus sp. NKZ332]|nr:hypothetical protein FO519_003659 [Halicephalobus sp. NKZ332]